VSRRIYFHEEGPTADQIIEGLRDKYGREQWRDSKKALLWTSLKKGGSITPRQCSKLVKKIIPRTNMTRPWTRVFTRSERRRQTEKRLLKSEANIQKFQQCSNAVAEKYNGQWGQGNDEAVTRKFNSELTSCRRKSGLANEGSTGDAAERAPLMIGPNGSPGIYKKYRACGPMIVTLFNYSEGRLSDVSFIRFDPEWIADQPAFFFSKEKSKKKSRIKF